jgi:tetratricopeptide (TPR) repeat protein
MRYASLAALAISLALAGCAATPERAAWEVQPLRAEDFNQAGLALAAKGRHDEAIVQFQNAVALAPQSAYLHNNLGYAYFMRGLDERAIAELQLASRLDPHQEKAVRNLARAQARLAAQRAAPAAKPVPPVAPRAAQDDARLVQVAPGVYELKGERGAPASPARERWRAHVEVANGNGTRGLAARVSHGFGKLGVHAVRLTNERPYRQVRTEVRYRAGYEAEAASLARLLPGSVARSASRLPHGIDVRVVLGRDAGATLLASR